MSSSGDGGFGDVHEVCQAPVLLGVTAVELDLKAQAVVVPQLVIGELPVAAEQDDLRPGVRLQVRFDEDDDSERLRANSLCSSGAW